MLFFDREIEVDKITDFGTIGKENTIYIFCGEHIHFFKFENYLKFVSGYILFLKKIETKE